MGGGVVILHVTPEEFERMMDAGDRAHRTLDGSCNDRIWVSGLREIFGGAITDRMLYAGPVQVVVDWHVTTSLSRSGSCLRHLT